MSFDDISKKLHQSRIQKELRLYQITHLWLFGSHAKNTNHANSDVDLLYQTDDSLPRKPWGIFGAKAFLEEKLGVSCDLVNIDCIDDTIRQDILHSKKVIW